MARDLLSRRQFVALVPAVMASHSLPAWGANATVSGSVTYPDTLDLPVRAMLAVALRDVTRGPEHAEIVAEFSTRIENQSPVPYELTFEASRITTANTYVLDARITVDDNEILSLPASRRFYGAGSIPTNLAVEAPLMAFARPTGQWLAEDIAGRGVMDRLQSTLNIKAGDRAGGHTGCNSFGVDVKIDRGTMQFSLTMMMMTMRACTDPITSQEDQFLAALGRTRRFLRRPEERKLILMDTDWHTVMRLVEMS